MANNRKGRGNQTGNAQDMSFIVQKINEMHFAAEQYNIATNQYNVAMKQCNIAVKQYKEENPDIDVEALLSEEKDLIPTCPPVRQVLGLLPNRELDKFISYAQKQGTKMSFDAMEMGVLAAGRTDMQNGLAQILNALEFDTPVCPECNKEMKYRGRSKKKEF